MSSVLDRRFKVVESMMGLLRWFAKGLMTLADWLGKWFQKFSSGWFQIYPMVDALDFQAVHNVNGSFAIAVGKGGIIYRTADGGVTWEELNSGVQEDLYGVCFVDTSVGYVVGNAGTVLKTTDAGSTWQQLQENASIEARRLRDVKFWDHNNGIVVGGLRLYEAAYARQKALIMRTQDGGVTWEYLYPVPDVTIATNYWDYVHLGMLHSVTYLDANTLIAVGGQWFKDILISQSYLSGSPLLKSTDSGATWELIEHPLQSSPYPSPLLCVDFVDDSHGVALGERNSAIYTNDGGSHWTMAAGVPCINFTMRGVSFPSTAFTLAVGIDNGRTGVMLDSRDGGDNWVIPTAPKHGDFQSVSFVDDQNGIAVGHGSTVVHTTDGGANWLKGGSFRSDPMVGDRIMGLSFPDANTGYAVGWFGGLYATVDEGANWDLLNQTGGSLFTVAFADPQRGYFGGARLYATLYGGQRIQGYDVSDDGQSYTLISGERGSATFSPYDVSLVGASDGFILGKNENGQAVVLATIDAGNTWTTVATLTDYTVLPPQNRNENSHMHFINTQVGFIVGVNRINSDESVILKTSDGGNTWSEKWSEVEVGWAYMHAIQFINNNVGYALGTVALKTVDGGESWTLVNRTLPGTRIEGAYFVDENRGWGFRDRHIYYTDDGCQTWNEQTLNTGAIPPRLLCIHFVNQSVGFIGGEEGTLLRTTTGGA